MPEAGSLSTGDRTSPESSPALAECQHRIQVFLQDARRRVPGMVERKSRFGPNRALWLENKEIVHVHSDGSVDIRLTRQRIRRILPEFKTDPRIRFRRSEDADWVVVCCQSTSDEDFCLELIELAGEANCAPVAVPSGRTASRARA